MSVHFDFPPRLLQARAAAHYLGCSPTKLRTLPIPTRKFGGNVVWDRVDLDAYADNLPILSRGDCEQGNTCDELFGTGSG